MQQRTDQDDALNEPVALEELEELEADLLKFIFAWESEQLALPAEKQDCILSPMLHLDLLSGATVKGSA